MRSPPASSNIPRRPRRSKPASSPSSLIFLSSGMPPMKFFARIAKKSLHASYLVLSSIPLPMQKFCTACTWPARKLRPATISSCCTNGCLSGSTQSRRSSPVPFAAKVGPTLALSRNSSVFDSQLMLKLRVHFMALLRAPYISGEDREHGGVRRKEVRSK